MKLGLRLPQSANVDYAADVAHVARRAEEIGYAGLWVYERVLFPITPTDGMYGVPGLPWDPYYQYCADPLTVLTLAAAATSRVRLGTSILVGPLHNELHLARTLATLDLASRSRVVLGVGSGWSTDEYRAAGADFAARGRSMEELVDALRALWSPNPVTYADSRMSVENALANPKPHRPIPIAFGGGGELALKRVAAKGDGWIPSGLGRAELAAAWKHVHELAESNGRDPQSLQLLPLAWLGLTDAPLGAERGPFQGTVAQVVEDLAAYAEAGADEVIIGLEATTKSVAELVDRAEEIMEAARGAGVVE
jgi:probable F420-dependent oxidoreductase